MMAISLFLVALVGLSSAQNVEEPFFFKLMGIKQSISEPTTKNIAGISTLFYNQTLDHFGNDDEHTWNQRYFVNDEFFNGSIDAPVFLKIGGEGPASASSMKAGAWYGYAREVGALMLQLEHRFYGESQPTGDMSVDNLLYLSSQQAILDIAQFIGFAKRQYNLTDSNKWVTFGGSYPGSLSLWMRSLFPELVSGALSSSAPVEAKVDFEEYVSIIDKDMHVRDPSCSGSVIEGINQLEKTIANGSQGWEEVEKIFSLCDGWSGDRDKDVKTLFMSIVEAFAIGAQYDSNDGIENVSKLCSHMRNLDFGKTNMERLGKTVNIVYGGSCLNANYKDMIDKMKIEKWSVGGQESHRQWIFQTCNEFGWYQTGNLWGSFLPVSYFLEQCEDVYGPRYNKAAIYENVRLSNSFYGSKNPPLSNTIITHGSFDPWHPMGILEDMSDTVKAFIVNGTSHCFDLQSPDPANDSEQLSQVRRTTFEHIKKWIV